LKELKAIAVRPTQVGGQRRGCRHGFPGRPFEVRSTTCLGATMRTFFVTAFLGAATAANAHPGHVAADAGHSHYLAIGAATLAIVLLAAILAPRIRRWRADVRARRRNAG
jgi:ADP-ribosylglycohydrolase